ncbi:MAG TPA: LacI family transcriptional regulator [Candidatus Microbacterium stercoravium]|uniref:LacI family transcriptional regulator n=1 Tax=Candidatus Microbacterium stercoravium TaxID=2838697 RepID=A0A9D2H3V7_9MICO|nr:LacI family transcriptional regulator [Candidatus Microbacterium stercoravium]
MATKRTSREATISDIAAAAGVSKATVSRVMNGVATVNEEIAQRVRATVAELGYSPSATARSLSLGESRTVGVVVPDLANPMFHQVLHGLNRAAERDGYRVLVADTQEHSDAESETVLDIRNRTDAIALFAPRMSREKLLELLPNISPVVVFNRTTGKRAGAVLIDYADGIGQVARHLIALGHTRIAYLQGPPQARSNMARQDGLDLVSEEHPDVDIVGVPCGSAFEDGYGAWPAVRETRATGVIAFNDVVALGFLGRLSEEDVRVPEDISVAGFDDIPFSRYSSPSLTTMTARLGDVGERIWTTLLAQMRGEADLEPTMFAPELAARSSTGAAR